MAGLREECGVVGVIGHPEASNLAYLSLYALQHRGQEACGIVSRDKEGKLHARKANGLVSDAFDKEALGHLPGTLAMGHVRYSTQGGRLLQNIQPFYFNSALGPIVIAHNGNLTNANQLKQELEEQGAIFQSTSDTEIFMHLFARSRSGSITERLKQVMVAVKGAYSLTLMAGDRLYAIRDPYGFRPLVLGRLDQSVIVASETCALDLIDAKFEREIEPGEILGIAEDGTCQSEFPLSRKAHAFCSFEPIYFARPDSRIFHREIYHLRKEMGRKLFQQNPIEADVVIAVPDSGVPLAMGYSEASGIPHELGLVRNHYVGRTFIEPSQSIRDFGVKLKLNPVPSVLKDRRVVVIDDSIVRGTTSVKIIRMIREAGAAEIHFRVGSPPITHSCYFGVDTPGRSRLLAAQKDCREMADYIGCDSLAFLTTDSLRQVLEPANGTPSFCYGCFTGSYPEETFKKIPEAPTDRAGPGVSYRA